MTRKKLDRPATVKRTYTILVSQDQGLEDKVRFEGESKDYHVRKALDLYLAIPEGKNFKPVPAISGSAPPALKTIVSSEPSVRSSDGKKLCPNCRKVFTGEECPKCKK